MDQRLAEGWLPCVAAMLGMPRPYHEPYWVTQAGPLPGPGDVHPAFGNCYDWHSSVHMHWSGLRLVADHPGLREAEPARTVLAKNLTTKNLEVEARFLAERRTYERPYGRAWALMLVAEIEGRRPPFLAELDTSVLREELVTSLVEYAEQLVRPERAGQHRNTAFNLILARHAADKLGEGALVEVVQETARRLFLGDVAAPCHLEPSGEDFLSPSLAEAHLLSQVLAPGPFVAWLDGWLPSLSAGEVPGSLARPFEVPVTDDPRIVHLHRLNLSRAFHLDALANTLPSDGVRKVALQAARATYGSEVLAAVVRDDIGSDHWLVTYGLLALEGLS